MNLSDMVRKMQELGYETDDAEARVCQDIGIFEQFKIKSVKI